MKEGGTSLHKTFRQINLVFKGFNLINRSSGLTVFQHCNMIEIHIIHWFPDIRRFLEI